MDKNFQASFISFLMGKAAVPQGFKMFPCQNLSFDEALGIYRNNYYGNLKKSLSQTYEACFVLFTEEVFDKLAFSFIKQYPFKQSSVAFYGEEFPAFLKKSKAMTASLPFLPELAELENTIKKVFLYNKEREEMKITYPVHQIWQSLLYNEEEIEDFDGEKNLTIQKDDKENLFFSLGEAP